MIATEAIPGHIIETVDIIIGVLQDTLTLVLIVPTVTSHITDLLQTGVHQLTLGTRTEDNSCSIYKPSKKAIHESSMHPSRTQDKLHDKRNPRVMIDDQHMDFYSSNDNSSDSEDDHHLN